MNFLSLDLSLASTGWAAKKADGPIAYGTFEPETKGIERLNDVVLWLDEMLEEWAPNVVIVEGYSFGSKYNGPQLGEVGGVVRFWLYRKGFLFVVVQPKVRAKLATGNGNGSKAMVLVETVKRLGYDGSSFDEADALWLLQALLIHYEQDGAVQLPQKHLEYISQVGWPKLTEVGT